MAEDRIIGFNINKDGYGTIPKSVMQDTELNIASKALYAYFCSFTGAGDVCFPTRKKICFDLGISNDSLSKYLRQLIENGYLIVEQVKEKGRFSHNVYTLPDTKLPCPKNSDTVKTEHGKTDTKNNSSKINSIYKINKEENSDSILSNTTTENLPNTTIVKISEKGNKETRHKYGEYKNVLLSDTDLEKLKSEFPTDWETRIEKLSCYMESTGKSYKNHLATIRNWARRNANSPNQPKQQHNYNYSYGQEGVDYL